MKKLLLGFAFVLASTAANAAYLYWQIDTSQFETREINSATTYWFNGHQISAVRIANATDHGYVGEEDFVSFADPLTAASVPIGTAVQYSGGDVLVAAVAESGSYSYYVEIVGYDSAVYGEGTGVIGVSSEYLTYADSHGKIVDTLDTIASVPTAWTGGTYAAPEPTSGLLLLVGASLLALKRRKV